MSLKHTLAFLPLLSILALSPNEIIKSNTSRSIASVIEKAESFPKLAFHSKKIDHKSLKIAESINSQLIQEHVKILKDKIEAEKKEKKQPLELVSNLFSLEQEVKALKEKKAIDEKELALHEKSINELKQEIEPLLPESEKSSQSSMNISIQVVEEDKTEEPKKVEEPKKEEKEEVVAEKSEEKKEEDCDLSEKYQLLSKQVDQLIQDQKNIMQNLLNITQAMVYLAQSQAHQTSRPNFGDGNPYNVIPYGYYSGQLQSPALTYGQMPQYSQMYGQQYQAQSPAQFAQPMQQQSLYFQPQQVQQAQVPSGQNWVLPQDTQLHFQPGNFGMTLSNANQGFIGGAFL